MKQQTGRSQTAHSFSPSFSWVGCSQTNQIDYPGNCRALLSSPTQHQWSWWNSILMDGKGHHPQASNSFTSRQWPGPGWNSMTKYLTQALLAMCLSKCHICDVISHCFNSHELTTFFKKNNNDQKKALYMHHFLEKKAHLETQSG